MREFKKIMIDDDEFNIARYVFGGMSEELAYSLAFYTQRYVKNVYTTREQVKGILKELRDCYKYDDSEQDRDFYLKEFDEYFADELYIEIFIDNFLNELCEDIKEN